MIEREEYLNNLLAEIDRVKNGGGPGVFKIREKLTPEVATYVRDYLEKNTKYRIDIRNCQQCSILEWDIMIIF